MYRDKPGPLQSPETWDGIAAAYTTFVAPVHEDFAREALRRAGVGPNMEVVDVACGPGTLSFLAAKAGARVKAIDFAPAMIDQLRARAVREGCTAIEAVVGDGAALPYPDAHFDAGFSMFGLMFFPDRAAGFRELSRVLEKGAPAVVSSWVPLERVPIMHEVMVALSELMPGPKPAPAPPPLVDPESAIAEMTAGGFENVAVHEFSARLDVPSTAALMASIEESHAYVVFVRKSLGEAWKSIADAVRARIDERFGLGPHHIVMPANLIVGTRV